MSRNSENEINANTGLLWNGFDYERQAWVIDGVYQKCGHPESMRKNGRSCCSANDVAGLKVLDLALAFPDANTY